MVGVLRRGRGSVVVDSVVGSVFMFGVGGYHIIADCLLLGHCLGFVKGCRVNNPLNSLLLELLL